MPETSKTVPVPPGWVMVPALLEVSPQSMEAVNWLEGAAGLASVKVATGSVKAWPVPRAGSVTPVALMAESVTVAVLVPVAVLRASAVSVTVTLVTRLAWVA